MNKSKLEQECADLYYDNEKLVRICDEKQFQIEELQATLGMAEATIEKLQKDRPPLNEDDWHRMVRDR